MTEVPLQRSPMPIAPILGMLLLMWSGSVYSAFGISAFPRQEWLLETLAAIVFIIPVVNLLRGSGSFNLGVRLVGMMLLLHSGWDALHWPGHAWIDTPIDPRFPEICPFLDLPVGAWLLIRGT